MDVELLSKMIAELIVDHDRVGLPGVGTFFTELVPSTFSDRGYTINPPYRRLSFLPNAVENDLLVDFYAEVNGIPADVSREYLIQFLAELCEVLKERKTIILPGLGRLRATRENNIFFVPDENLDIYPEAFGLAPVSLKNLPASDDDKVEIPFEFKARMSDAAAVSPVQETADASAAVGTGRSPEPEPLTDEEPDTDQERHSGQRVPEPVEPAVAEPGPDTGFQTGDSGLRPTEPESAEPGAPVSESGEPAAAPEPSTAAPESAMAEPESAAGGQALPVTEPVEPAITAPEAPSDGTTGSVLAQSAPEPEPSAAGPGQVTGTGAEAGGAEPSISGDLLSESAGEALSAAPEAAADISPETADISPEADDAAVVRKKFRWWIPLLAVFALAAVALAAFLILADVAPDFIDSILYTPEELRIINY